MKKYDILIVGAGFAGSIIAREFANIGKKILIIEKRNHIAGNMYEKKLENNVRAHVYGPHIFHTNKKYIFDYIKQYSDFYFYELRVTGLVDNTLIPIPFNFKSLELLFNEEDSKIIIDKLKIYFPDQKTVSVIELINHNDIIIRNFGDFVYNKVYVNYVAKQWNVTIDKIEASVINRVPIVLSYDDRYFQDQYQFMPKEGYTNLFENMLHHDNIDIHLNTKANSLIKISDDKIIFDDKIFNGILVYTGAIDELLNYKYGALPYRSLDLHYESYDMNYYQASAVVSHPNDAKYTRITEFKYLTNQFIDGKTSILKEYPLAYDYKNEESIPFYAIMNKENIAKHQDYINSVKNIKNLYFCGRLADYKYYNMDEIIAKSLDFFDKIKKNNKL